MDVTKSNTSALAGALGAVLQQAPVSGVWVAYSGGLDSHVLLHLAAQFNQHHPDLPVRAIHIHHQIQAISAQWVKHCERQCEVLGIPLVVHTLTLDLDSGESIEALARTGRYQVFSQLLEANEILFTAHHQDDQAETLLLNLLRGAGMAGLAAMPVQRALGKGYLVRPLLGFARAELEHYAHTHQLDYIDDPSNTDTRFNRNLLRHQVIPLLERRWPATKALLARAAQHQQEALALTQTLLQEQLKQVQGSKPHTLSVQKLGKHTAPLQKALIRAWLEQLAFLMPSTARLDSILTTVLPAKVDANPLVQWSGCEVRRYRDDLYALKPLGQPRHSQVVWTGQNTLIFNEYLIQPDSVQAYLTAAQETQTLFKVCIRQGGERFKQGKQWLDLKTYWQTKGIPPWERERRPLIYFKGELISIPEVEFDQTLV